MKRLNYNIYTNLTDDSFITICNMLIPVESAMFHILEADGWRLHSPVANSDALSIDFIKKDSAFYGNIGIKFEDRPNKVTFTFYVTKAFDENNYRYFLRNDFLKEAEFSSFENKIDELTSLSLKRYNNWKKDDIMKLGEKYEIG